jgi:hypothetical protein
MASSPSETQRARKTNPRESWDWLRLKVWRLQQRVAARLRGLRRRYGKHGTVIATAFRKWIKSGTVLVSEGLTGGLIVYGSGIRSTVTRRLVQVVRERLDQIRLAPVRLKEHLTGESCVLCGDQHASHRCFVLLARALAREEAHQVQALARMKEDGYIVVNEIFPSDDIMRVAMSRVLMGRSSRSRIVGAAKLALLVARKVIPLSTGMLRLGISVLDDFLYVATGWRFVPARSVVQIVYEAVFPSLTLASASDAVISEARAQGLRTLGSLRVTVAVEIQVGVRPPTGTVANPPPVTPSVRRFLRDVAEVRPSPGVVVCSACGRHWVGEVRWGKPLPKSPSQLAAHELVDPHFDENASRWGDVLLARTAPKRWAPMRGGPLGGAWDGDATYHRFTFDRMMAEDEAQGLAARGLGPRPCRECGALTVSV